MYLCFMKTEPKKSTSQLHAELRKRIGPSGFKSNEDFEKMAGLFEGMNITLKSLREKAWKRK